MVGEDLMNGGRGIGGSGTGSVPSDGAYRIMLCSATYMCRLARRLLCPYPMPRLIPPTTIAPSLLSAQQLFSVELCPRMGVVGFYRYRGS